MSSQLSRRLVSWPGILLCAVAFLLSAQGVLAQHTLRGRVMDPNKAALAGAAIKVNAIGRPATPSTTTTNQNGEFFLELEPGEYSVQVVAEGFATSPEIVHLKEGDSESLEIVLQLADSIATVTITDTAGLQSSAVSSATRTLTRLRDLPQSITVVGGEQMREQSMDSIADAVSYVPGITSHQGENNRDQLVIRGNSTSADFFLNGVRDDVQYYRDLYNVDRLEALKGPNAMIFGRGGGGGVVNRVTKEAVFTPLSEVTTQGGSFGNRRGTVDFNRPVSRNVAFRIDGMYENSNSFRKFVKLERYGINPTLTIIPGAQTRITLSYERFHDQRVADRGIPSFRGQPIDVPISTFFGNPKESKVRAGVHLASAAIEHQAGRLNIRNRTMFGDYDRFYRNFVPGPVTADKTKVALSAYSNATRRRNVFNQTDLTYSLSTGKIKHMVLAGTEMGQQLSDNYRNTGFFNNTAISFQALLADPVISTPVTFRQSATDANNHLTVKLGAAYAQDQIELSRFVQVIAGLRFDYFDLKYHNNRTGDNLRRIDHLLSPRVGVVLKPTVSLSVYGNYSVSYLPSSGDQFSSLTTLTQQVKPEKFDNYELGAKWDARRHLALTAAVYRLNRTNTRATDPADPTRVLQTGSQRTNGFEVGVNGNVTRDWRMAGGYAYQDAFVTSDTNAARAGAQIAQVPHHTFSLWNHYQVLPKLGAGIGIVHRSDMFAAIDNTVSLPGYVKIDAAVDYAFSEKWRLQANLENLLNRHYFINADGNNNISPGPPRGVRLGLVTRF